MLALDYLTFSEPATDLDVVYLVAFEVVVEDYARPQPAEHEDHAHDGREQPELDEHDRHLCKLLPGHVRRDGRIGKGKHAHETKRNGKANQSKDCKTTKDSRKHF